MRVRGRSGRHYEVEASVQSAVQQTPWTTGDRCCSERDFDSEKAERYSKLPNIHEKRSICPLAIALHPLLLAAQRRQIGHGDTACRTIHCLPTSLLFTFQEEMVVTRDMIDETAAVRSRNTLLHEEDRMTLIFQVFWNVEVIEAFDLDLFNKLVAGRI